MQLDDQTDLAEETQVLCPLKKEELILSEKKICSTFNTYFGNIVQSLNLFQWSGSLLNNQRLCVKLNKPDAKILKYQHHLSIKMIKDLLTYLFLIYKQYLRPMSRK